jgi:tetratricopeptide (TPR) repeat protein
MKASANGLSREDYAPRAGRRGEAVGPGESAGSGAGESDDLRVAEAAREYLAALEAGRRPAREEFLARYPGIGPALRECLDGLDHLHAVCPRAPVAQGLADDTAPPPGGGISRGIRLGDFRIRGEAGRGGMGVVYEAEQVSLGRRVALKVLPLAASLDARHLQRFQNEARAAAQLHHPNVVPVYFVGCERGVHFYAMQFIDGKSLAALVQDLRGQAGIPPAGPQETDVAAPRAGGSACAWLNVPGCAPGKGREFFRAVAHLGAQAAEALDYAHQFGVVHRDVKPGNLLVERGGHLWLTDFGLAHCQRDAALTATGDLVGTLRYMSPEQALARRVVIDHRTDVYSLGATLYELLTLRPPFGGEDRQTLLRQITSDEPRPPRRLNRTVPAELETVVLKAMSKSPAERYQTAQELADDLRRFLDDRPVLARGPALPKRAGRWCRRHRRLVAAAGLLVLAALVLGGLDLARRQRQRAALEQGVSLDLGEAERLQKAGRWAEALQAVERAAGRLAEGGPGPLRWRVARCRREVALVAELEEAHLRRSAGADGALDYAASDRAYAAAFAASRLDPQAPDPEESARRVRASPVRRQLVAALDDWAYVKDRLRASSGRRLWAVARRADDDPIRQQLRDPGVRGDRAALERLARREDILTEPPATLEQLSLALEKAGGRAAAERLLRRAQRRHPDDFWITFNLACLLHRGPATKAQAVGFWRAALALRPGSSVVRTNLAAALLGQGEAAEAEGACRRAVALQPGLAAAHNNLGAALRQQGKLAQAVAAFRRAVALKADYAQAWTNLGAALQDQNRPAEAAAAHKRATAINPQFTDAWISLGSALRDQGRLAEAEAAQRKAAEADPRCAEAYSELGSNLREQGKLAEAVRACRRAVELRPDWALAHARLGAALSARGQLAEAVRACRRALELKPDLAEAYNNLATALGKQGDLAGAVRACRKALALKPGLAAAHVNLGGALLCQGKAAEAERASRWALALRPDLAEAHCNLGHALRLQGRFAEAAAALRRGHELGSRRPTWPYPSARWVQDCERLAGQARPGGAR